MKEENSTGGRTAMHNGGASISDVRIQWHPAFCAATELGLMENREELDFWREYNLSKKPLQIDLLVVEKRNDDFFKAVGYACIYKGLGETVNAIPADQLTVSLFRESRPVGLFGKLGKHGLTVERKFAGIYYVSGFFFPVQIVVTKELDGGKNSSLKVLSRNARGEDVREFVERAQGLTAQGDRANADAVLQASVMANYELYDEMRRRDSIVCEAMRRLMKDEIADALSEGRQEGRQEGFLEALFGLVRDDILSVTDAAKRANMNVHDFEKAYKTFCL